MIDPVTHMIILTLMFVICAALNPTRPNRRAPPERRNPADRGYSGQPNASAIRKARHGVYRARLEVEGNDGYGSEGSDLQVAKQRLRALEHDQR